MAQFGISPAESSAGRERRRPDAPSTNLQYWHGGRNNVRYVGEADYPVYAEAIAGYREFMRLVEEYVDLMTGITGIDPITRPRTADYIALQG